MLRINIYTDETYSEVKETREAARIKIPYKVAKDVLQIVQGLDLADDRAIFQQLLKSEEYITRIVKATFGLTEDDLEYIETGELYDTGKEIVQFVIDKMAAMGITMGDNDPNA